MRANNWRSPTSSKCKWAVVHANLNPKHILNRPFIARKMVQRPPLPPSSSVHEILSSVAI